MLLSKEIVTNLPNRHLVFKKRLGTPMLFQWAKETYFPENQPIHLKRFITNQGFHQLGNTLKCCGALKSGLMNANDNS